MPVGAILVLIGLSLIGMEYYSSGFYLAAFGAGSLVTGVCTYLTDNYFLLLAIFAAVTLVLTAVLTKHYGKSGYAEKLAKSRRKKPRGRHG